MMHPVCAEFMYIFKKESYQTEKEKLMNIYYIDYENVTSQGLKGIELLTESDEVNLLYSKKAETMKIDILTQLLASRAKINFIPVHVGTPNALDFQLITLLFLHYSKDNMHYIISKDSGYDCCIKTAAENDAVNILRFPSIESAARGMKQDRQQRSGRRSGGRQNRQNAASEEAKTVIAQETAPQPSETILQAADPAVAGNDLPENTAMQTGAMQQTDADSQPQQVDTDSQPQEADTDSQLQQTDTDNQPEQADESQNSPADSAAPEEPAKKRPTRRRGRRKSASSQAESESVPDSQPQEKQESPKSESQRSESPRSENQKSESQKSENRKSDPQKPVTVLSVIRRRNDVQLDLNQIEMIRNALKTSSNKQQFYNYFVKKLGQKKGIELYHSIKSSYTDLINANLV